MFWELIAVLVAGVGGAGLMLLLSKISGGRLPRWAVPVGAGLAMLATTISSEYGWYGRTASALPEGVTVADTHLSRAAWRPWTYAFPMVDRFVAVDVGGLRANAESEDTWMADVYFFARWQPVTAVQIVVDCPGGRRAAPSGDGGTPQWVSAGPEDPLVRTVCQGDGA